MSKTIGVFDSGIGGAAIAAELKKTLGNYQFLVVDDKANAPYGDRTEEEIIELTDRAIQPLVEAGCQLIVLACNTATTVAISELRSRYPHLTFVGIEPMIKTAAKLSKSGKITVCATPLTLKSARYHYLKTTFGSSLEITEPDCSHWAAMIETNRVNREEIETVVAQACEQGSDVIVLGCTHYHWIKELIEELAQGRAQVIEPSRAITRQVRRLLEEDA